ncbi:hypothetical protein EG68_07668 [Paragonimus skrjabini miyazakii]|uniref:Uncharacterized protein n=1 Tax=Paragonimus skrjabini miyazakii TaxID=59628 RepID=A0A8S9YR79_9TREM|nr:hypothetical protein EG68_07668 [Paragonimus skrjabini miyazakii]
MHLLGARLRPYVGDFTCGVMCDRKRAELDYLQRCLKRYEIERVEAGEAVRRIEDRLQELQERTSDLLAGYVSLSVDVHVHKTDIHQTFVSLKY